jgi:dihydroxyacetone kinase-like protein
MSIDPRTRSRLGRSEVLRYVERAGRTLERHRALLDRLDASLGDGDHGENMVIGFSSVSRLRADPGDDMGELFRKVGHRLVAEVGGASGPLYGTAFIEAGFALAGRNELDLGTLATAFEAGARGLARRGRCGVGDKTILDALAPAAQALRTAADRGDPLEVALGSAAWAARAGMRATIPMIARRGLALRLGERSRGHQDPGATSCFLLVRAMLPDRAARKSARGSGALRERAT